MPVRNVVVGIVHRHRNEVEFLVLHRILIWKGWEFPKGGVEQRETEDQALRRELREETGIDNVKIIAKLPINIKYKYQKKYSKQFKYTETSQSVFLALTDADEVRLSAEHDDYKWLPYGKARRQLKHTNQRRALDVAWKYLNESKQ